MKLPLRHLPTVFLAPALACAPTAPHDAPDPGVADADLPSPDVVPEAPDAAAPDAGPGPIEAQVVAAGHHSCALSGAGAVRCWGYSHVGQIGYGTTDNVGDDETPASVGDVNVGGTVVQLAAGDVHTCALLDTGAVRCWGTGWYGRLGYGNTNDIGDDEKPAVAGDVDVGGTVVQLSGGYHHTCALLDTGGVRCWGYGRYGSLGYGNTQNVGDDEPPAVVGDVPIGYAVAQVSAGYWHTCALLTTGAVRCWGWGADGQLGYGNTEDIGDNELPSSAGNVPVGGTVVQLAGGYYHTCALLDTGAVRCWGRGDYGALGYGSTQDIGDDETPASAGDVDLGGAAVLITTGLHHSCALLEDGAVKCWGRSDKGQLGYANTASIGDNETPASVGAVDIASMSSDDVGVTEIHGLAAGHSHTCALLGNDMVRCWGNGTYGQLGYANTDHIGDDETPESAGNVPLF